jgi:hypothetical protein
MIAEIDLPELVAASFKAASRIGSDGKLRISFGLGLLLVKVIAQFILLALEGVNPIANENVGEFFCRSTTVGG